MIAPGITLEEVDEVYKRMGLKELFVLPWREDGQLVGLITGQIDHKEKIGFLERIIVLPEAKHKLRVMQQMPHAAAGLALAAGCTRVLLCISHDDDRKGRLQKWAEHCGYTRVNEDFDGRSWWALDLTEGDDDNG
jgi:hypothetical protein